MGFAHDTNEALQFAAILVNTAAGARGGDELGTVDQLDAFLDEHQISGRRDRDEAELAAVHRLRRRLRRLWHGGRDEMADEVNSLLRDVKALPQLVRHDGLDYHVHAVPAQAALVTRLAAEIALAFLDIVREDQLDRLRTCAAEDCDDVVIDLSRNRSKLYCDGGCGNRVAAAAYRARRAAD